MPKRQQLIENIMSNSYGDDDPKYYDSNLKFLNSLSTRQLEAMADLGYEVIDEL